MTIVYTAGTFDYFHYGHYNLLERCSKLGDKLIVAVSSDKFCKEKLKNTILSEEKRLDIVSNLKFVDKVILEESMSQKVEDAIKYKVNIFVLGDDYKDIFTNMIEYKQLLDLNIKIIFLDRTKDISTTILKSKLPNISY